MPIKTVCKKLVDELGSNPWDALDGISQLTYRWALDGLRAYEETGRNAWIGEFFPTEVCQIFDLVPVHVEGLIALMFLDGSGGPIVDEGVKYTQSRDICSFQHGGYGGIYAKTLPSPDVILRFNVLCDGREKILHVASHEYKKPYLYVDVPDTLIPSSMSYIAKQYEALFKDLERLFGPLATESKIREVFHYSNQVRENLLKIEALRKKGKTPYHDQYACFITPVLAWYLGHDQELVKISQRILKEIEAYQRQNPPSDERRFKILLMLLPFMFPFEPFFQWQNEQMKLDVLLEEMGDVFWRPLDPDKPFESLAWRCLDNFSIGPLERRLEHALKLAKGFQADGIVHISHWGCRHIIAPVKVMKDFFSGHGIPFIDVDADLGDSRNVDLSAIKSRLEGFLSILKS
ncbi:MAG: 2-hydroxyacyl-CoA dehydratase [Candidatus Tectomicrobia bacterium]|uniref:2-hydroxyacyl-CoA dehydratase n=1 Tax=Tectimicrobiota bacterium TaxID=2528274 RepID=A0A933GJ44_UNCTE|nr:2-hydroxyacyl-CoA dehydratase [Candidatus Tectomicrobia bacterium]